MTWYYIYIIISSSRDPWPSWTHGWGGQLTEPKWICWGRLWMLQQLLLPHIDDIWAGFVQPKLPFQWNKWWETRGFWGYISWKLRQTHIILLLVWCSMIIWTKIQWLHPNICAIVFPIFQKYPPLSSMIFPALQLHLASSMTSDRTGTFVNEVASRHHLRRPHLQVARSQFWQLQTLQIISLAQKTWTVMCSFCF